jgi:beta-lactamase class A
MRVLIGLIVSGAWLMSGTPQKRPMDPKPIEGVVSAFDGGAALFARNLLTGEEIAVHADERFPTASTIKTAVMLEAFYQASEGTLSLDDSLTLTDAVKVGGSGVLNGLASGLQLRIRDLVHLMIVLSDNTATNLLVNRLGTKRIDARLVRLGLGEIKIFRPTFRDGKPDIHPELEREFGLGMSTARDMGRLMALIAERRAVSAEASASMFATLCRQQDRAMIPRLLPAGLQVGNKTGTDSEKQPDTSGHRGAIRADAAIVQGEGIHYVVAILTRRGKDTQGGVDNAGVLLGARLSRLVYDAWKP